jgi:hypothetical protein
MPRTGRPKRDIDLKVVEKLGRLQCSIKEIAAFLDIPDTTLKSREDFSSAYKKGLEVGKMGLRRTQFNLAKKSAGMAIWLGKQYLDQVDSREIDIPDADQYFQKIADAIIRSDTNTGGILPRQPQVCGEPSGQTLA